IVPFSTLHYREDPSYWARWFPADFITESFPGQFRNWFYSLLAMSTVLRREPPFRTIFGYSTLFGEDGRPRHKSWGNAIEFDEAAERMGVDVMRWMYVNARPEDNILFGWHAADDARRRLLVLWNVYAFFVTYARLAGWTPRQGVGGAVDAADAAGAPWPALDRWILSRSAGLAEEVHDRLLEVDAVGAGRAIDAFVEDLSTWYLRRSRDRMRAGAQAADREAAFATLHAALVGLVRVLAPVLPFLAESMYQNLVVAVEPTLPDSVHLTRWPAADLARFRDPGLEAAMATARRAAELVRTLRSQAGIRLRQPLASLWLALPGGSSAELDALLDIVREEVNVKAVELIGDESELVERRVRPLLPKIGRRLGPAIPAVMAAAREGAFRVLPDGSVELAGVTLAPDEVEVLASPRPGTAVAHDAGLVVVVDTELTPELLADGDARELQRAVQDLRKAAELDLDDRIELLIEAPPALLERLVPYLPAVAEETLADGWETAALVGQSASDAAPVGWVASASVALDGGPVRLALRRRSSDG
ncbi:MAG TPA: DUF5915 domain-containing protein, partial [Candidatus Limnocylindrales bacterium]